MKSWFGCSPANDWVSMGVFSDGSYGTPEGVMFSFPVTTKDGRWSIVQVRLFILCHYSFN
jgi:malate dehydrogenase